MTSTIFLTVALVATAIFLIQFIVSIFFGEIDCKLTGALSARKRHP
jgi:hypothetical protein